MPIPKPISGESRESFVDRCVNFLIDENRPADQAVAICNTQWSQRDKRSEHNKYITWKAIDNKRESYVSYARNVFYKALRTQMNQYLDAVERYQKIDLQAETIVTSQPIEDAYLKVYSKVVPAFAQDSYNALQAVVGKAQSPDWNTIVQRWMAVNSTSLITGVTTTTQKAIEASVQTALVEGWSIPTFARNLRGIDKFSYARGELIGRTEIIRASNFGSLEGAIATGLPSKKSWLSTRDGRTRTFARGQFDHVIMDGQTRERLDADFDVNGQPMQYPGDISRGASPGNTINCRCTVVYEPLEETIMDYSAIISGASLLASGLDYGSDF